MAKLQGKRAIVTAGASGIGEVIATTLLAEGANVAVCDVSMERIQTFKERYPNITCDICDVSIADDLEKKIGSFIKQLGGVDILVNNAGIAGPSAAVEDISPKDWDRTVAVNLSATFYACKYVVPYMKEQKSGCIVNMSSAAGRLGFPFRVPYAAAKWGVIGLTETLAMELGVDGIRVNSILPGSVSGERMDRVISSRAELLGISKEKVLEDEIKNISMRRMINPQEIADLIAFICSESGCSISGQSLGICGNTETLR